MNLERVQKYYELIDRELGLESNDDLFGFGFESDEDDLFGFESDEDDLFGFESDEDDLFGFESDEEDLFGTEGVKDFFVNAKNKAKGAIKKSFAFVMNILRTIVSAITTWWKNKKIKKLVKLLKETVALKDDAIRDDRVRRIATANKDADLLLALMVECSNAEKSKQFKKILENVKSVSVTDDNFEKKMSDISGFSKLTAYILKAFGENPDGPVDSMGTKTMTIERTYKRNTTFRKIDEVDCNVAGQALSDIVIAVAIYSRKLTQYYQRKGETWFMQEADKNTLTAIKNAQKATSKLISTVNSVLKEAVSKSNDNQKEKAKLDKQVEKNSVKPETAPESIMSDIKEMMAANESLNDIIFDMEMDI